MALGCCKYTYWYHVPLTLKVRSGVKKAIGTRFRVIGFGV